MLQIGRGIEDFGGCGSVYIYMRVMCVLCGDFIWGVRAVGSMQAQQALVVVVRLI